MLFVQECDDTSLSSAAATPTRLQSSKSTNMLRAFCLLCDLKTYQQKQTIKAFLLKTRQAIRGRSRNKQEEVDPFIDFMNINDKVQILAKSTKQ